MNNIVNYRLMRGIWLIVIAFGLAACAQHATPPPPPPPPPGDDVAITIIFENDCPTGVAAGPIPKGRPGDKLVFQSRPADKDFTITFSPAAGRAYRTNPQGKVTIPLNSSALPMYRDQNEFVFKYSISAPNCPQIDPMVIVRR